MTASSNPTANPTAVLREEFDDWAVLFNPDTGDAVGLNPMAVAVWKLLDGQLGIGQIVERVKASFDAVPAEAEEEIRAFLQDLEQRGFLAGSSAGQGG